MKTLTNKLVLGALGLTLATSLSPSVTAQRMIDHKVEVRWNRLYDYDGIVAIMTRLQAAFPRFVTTESIGKSLEGRDLWVMTINNPTTGATGTKPAFYTDANIHGNEVQGAETNLYLAWYLLENYEHMEKVRELVDRTTFYIVPTVNIDGRAGWFRDPNTASSERSPHKPFDDDLDGRFDEDPANDLNGDGEITRMRKRVPKGEGQYSESKEYPGLMVRDPDGDYVLLGSEGIDDDGDGRINEDGPGYYDMNRNWPSGWNPNHLQRGAGEYPLSHPETRAIADFILKHPEIAGVQAFHNSGGMILRGPGLAEYGTYPRADVNVYDKLGKTGEFMLPFYRYMVIHKDLYSVAGGFVNWTYEGLGIFSFTNEMWTGSRMNPGAEQRMSQEERRRWDDLLTFGDNYVPWTEYEHPFYGTVEIGGARKMSGRTPPTWLIEEGLHRNAAFVAYHAGEMPEISLENLEVSEAPGGLRYIDVDVLNHRAIPSRSALSARKGMGLPDLLTLEGEQIEVVAVGEPLDRFRPERMRLQDDGDPRVLKMDSGVPGSDDDGPGVVQVRWIVRGKGPFRIAYTSQKATDRSVDGRLD